MVNDSRSMNSDFHQGTMDETYMSIAPDRGNPEHPPIERLAWPQYRNAEQFFDSAFFESAMIQSSQATEVFTGNRSHSDPRY